MLARTAAGRGPEHHPAQSRGSAWDSARRLPSAMADITISLPDGSQRSLPQGATATTVAESIGSRLAKAAVAAGVNGEEWDLGRSLPDGANVAIIPGDSDEGRHVLRHSTSHVMAQAVTQIFEGAKFSIGPAIENGFYYD